MVNFQGKSNYDIYDLVRLMELLCGPDGCPWDRAQTHESIRRNMLEEAYEAAEAIDTGNMEHLREELGDVLMQVVFHSGMAKKSGHFDIDEVADETCKKLIRRHPHIFGDVKVKDGQESLVVWDNIKRAEKKQETVTESLEGVARSLPALWRAEKIQGKAAKVGFDWHDISGVLAKLHEELGELTEAISSGGAAAAEELGDVLFAVTNLALHLDVDPEEVLHATCDKFISRFGGMEALAKSQGKELDEMTLEEMDKLYNQAKNG